MTVVRKKGSTVAKETETVVKDAAEVTLASALGRLLWTWGKEGVLITILDQTKKQIESALRDNRGELVADFARMSPDTKNNLLRWHQKAIADCAEDRFTRLLCKLPADKNCSRIYLLVKLNKLSDKEFEQMLYMLEHDNVLQLYQRAKLHIGRFMKEEGPVIEGAFRRAGEGIKHVARSIDQQAEEAAPIVGDALDKALDWVRRL